jgi:hypothetical protein
MICSLALFAPKRVMSDTTRNFSHRTRSKDKHGALRSSLLWTSFFLLLFGFTGRGWAQAADNRGISTTSIGPGLQFAIADFDGDRRPDLAYIEAGQGGPGTNTYWLDLRLSFQGPRAIRVLAPSGGLFLEARDVNGDHAVDLVVTTAWFRQPVAVLLNNGHGTFTAAKPVEFPDAFKRAQNNSLSGPQQVNGAVGALTQSRLGVDTVTTESHPLPQVPFRSLSSLVTLPCSSHLVRRGRAPPIRS